MDSAWEMYGRVKNYTDMDCNQSVSPHGITTVQSLVKNKEDPGSPKESDSEFSAATADFSCQHVSHDMVFRPGHHHTHGSAGAHDCIEGSSMGPGTGIGSIVSGHVTSPSNHVTISSPTPRQAHTPTFQQQQQLKWQALMMDEWHGLCDGALQDIPQIDFQVEIDKGFKFSELDDSFICQKKNHFQITVTTLFHRTPKYIKLKDGCIQPIEQFLLCLEGVKFEDVGSKIKLKQSRGDRSKIDFRPIVLDLSCEPDQPIRSTICRLHFSETTANNPRKRGKPNPDQKYFCLVVSLKARLKDEDSKPLTVVAHVSERIIVRTSPSITDVEVEHPTLLPSAREPTFEHSDCKREIEVLKAAVRELHTIVCDLQQRLGVTDALVHHPLYPHPKLLHTMQAQRSAATTRSLSHVISDTITVQHTQTAATPYSSSSQSGCNSHPHDFY